MVVAPSLNHRATGIYHCKDGYQLNGTARTDCNYGNWTGVTPRCQEMYCPFPGFLENGKVMRNWFNFIYTDTGCLRKMRICVLESI